MLVPPAPKAGRPARHTPPVRSFLLMLIRGLPVQTAVPPKRLVQTHIDLGSPGQPGPNPPYGRGWTTGLDITTAGMTRSIHDETLTCHDGRLFAIAAMRNIDLGQVTVSQTAMAFLVCAGQTAARGIYASEAERGLKKLIDEGVWAPLRASGRGYRGHIPLENRRFCRGRTGRFLRARELGRPEGASPMGWTPLSGGGGNVFVLDILEPRLLVRGARGAFLPRRLPLASLRRTRTGAAAGRRPISAVPPCR